MQRLNRSSLLLAAIFTSAMAANLFTNPPAPSQDANYDYSKNPVYQMGDSINIRWELAVKYEWVNMWIEAPPKGKPGENDINNYIQQFASVEEEFGEYLLSIKRSWQFKLGWNLTSTYSNRR